MGPIRPYSGIGKGKFPRDFNYGNNFFPFNLNHFSKNYFFIASPSWTKQINSKVGISSFITRTDVLKEKHEDRSRSNLYTQPTWKQGQFQLNLDISKFSEFPICYGTTLSISYYWLPCFPILILLFPFPKRSKHEGFNFTTKSSE